MNGLPLLSYPPPSNPEADESTCRRCNREFNFLFNRAKRCNHCGYSYCSSCADYQALMPRPGPETGYEVLPVCAFCMEMLAITASSKIRLRTLPLAKLRSYMRAYDIHTSGTAVEKDDLVDAILHAKGPAGCLLAVHEDFYRKNSIPERSSERSRVRNIFSRTSRSETAAQRPPSQSSHLPPQSSHPPPQPPRPPPQQRQYAPPPGPPPPFVHAGYPPHPSYPQYHQQGPHYPPPPPPPHSFYYPPPPPHSHSHSSPPPPPPSRPYSAQAHSSGTNRYTSSPRATNVSNTGTRQPPPRPQSAAPAPAQAPIPVPSLNSLLEKNNEEIAAFSISTLKSILFQNRVKMTLGVLEKQDLVSKVLTLVADERRDRENKEREEREEAERMMWARRDREREEERRRADESERQLLAEQLHQRSATSADDGAEGTSAGDESSLRPAPLSSPYADKLQDGLCVVCQDEHANMAIIDCGHLALCKACSDIILKTSRECPLCRTRIITEQRLLRIFKS